MWQRVGFFTALEIACKYAVVYVKVFILKQFFVFSAILCRFKSLGICAEGFWMRVDFLNEVRRLQDIQSVKSVCAMLYFKHPTLSREKLQKCLSSCATSMQVWWISQSVCVTWVICVQLCNYSKNFFLIHFFLKKTFNNVIGKNTSSNEFPHLYMNFHKDMCSI